VDEMQKALSCIRRIVRFIATGRISSYPTPVIASPTPVIARYFSGKPAFFVQVGSNDGLRGDPLHDLIKSNSQWFGVFIEPVEYVFKRLIKNYGNESRFRFEQIAIGDEAGEHEFYYVSEKAVGVDGLPDKCEQMGSFDRNHILKHSAALHPYIITQRIRCETLSSVLDRNRVERVDILHIDTEGYDYHVLRQIDFKRISPKLILYEHIHLKADELQAATDLLCLHGYRCVNFGRDTLAIGKG
jgi:FkbM family methyltransferase